MSEFTDRKMDDGTMNHWMDALTHGTAGRWLDGWVGDGWMDGKKEDRQVMDRHVEW